MTVSSSINTETFAGDGVSVLFTCPFRVLAAADLLVYLITVATGARAQLAYGADYTVSDVGLANAKFTTAVAYSNAYQLYAIRRTARTQETDYRNLDAFPAETHEMALDRLTMIAQEADEAQGRSIRVPLGSTLLELSGDPADYDGYYIGIAGGAPVYLLAPSGTAGALAADLASSSLAGKNSGQIGFSFALNYAVGTIGGVVKTLGIDITQPPYSADATGAADMSAAIAQCWTDFPGIPIRVPAGTYRWNTSRNFYPNAFVSAFGVGLKLYGDGIGKTIFDNRVAGGPMINIDSDGGAHAVFQGVLGVELHGFTIKNLGGAPANSTAIKLRTAYLCSIRQVHIIGMSAHGIEIPCTVGDNDGSNMLLIDQVRIENCAGWGIKADGDPGHNETSFIRMQHVFVQACGTNSGAATPPSGGMIWKGQMLSMQQCGFTLSENCGLFIPGQAGLAQTADIQNTTFENNKKRGFYCTGISAFKGRNLQFYNNNAYTATVQCEFDGASFTVRQVDIDGVVIRATNGNNPITAFKISGANADLATCRVKRVVWDNFDYAGQTRFDGWQFDAVQQQCVFQLIDAANVRFWPDPVKGIGATTPLRLRGGGGGVASASGEWVPYQPLSTGITLTTAGLAASTHYFAYLYDNNGAVALALSTVAPQQDAASGYLVNSGTFNATVLVGQALCVGAIATDGATNFNTGPGALNYAAAMTPNALIAAFWDGQVTISASNGVAFTINAPTNPVIGQIMTITIRNVSGGALGAATWNAVFKMSAWTQPANGQSRSITFRFGQSVWLQINQTGVDVPN